MKADRENKAFTLILPRQAEQLINILEASGYEAYIVGGFLRDRIMGREGGDVDIASSALPEKAAAILEKTGAKVLFTGAKHGTLTVILDGLSMELTTFREDGGYSDFRHPDKVSFSKSIEEDVLRRDFTVNALAYNPAKGLIDCCGGLSDIKNKIIRAVGDPEQRFREDALRILRALRFSSVLGFAIEECCKNAILNNKNLLNYVSAERIRDEFVKILCGDNMRQTVCEYFEVFTQFIPEISEMKGFEQNNPHHKYDVLEHSLRTVEFTEKDPIMRLSAFFHDSGKPFCYTEDDKGTGHFYGHAEISEKLTDSVLTRLKFDGNTKEKVLILVKEHGREIINSRNTVKRALSKLGEEIFFKLLKLKEADKKAQADGRKELVLYIEGLRRTAEALLAEKSCFSLKELAVNGDDLIKYGIAEGPEIGRTLKWLLDEVIDEKVPNEKRALLEKIQSQNQ